MKLTKIFFIIGSIFLLASCATTEKFTVYAPSGTIIYTPDNTNTPSVTVSSSEQALMEVSSDMYCGYILAQAPGSDVRIPIGLDYKIVGHNGTKLGLYTAGTLATIGLGGATIGAVAIALGASESMGAVVGALGGVGLVSSFTWMGLQGRTNQTAYCYNFGYEADQRLRIPALSSTLLNPNPPKNFGMDYTPKDTPSRKKATSGKSVTSKDTPENKGGSKVSRNRSDNAKKIEGTYSGSGKLMAGRNVEETYSQISVIIERIDKDHVSIRIIESEEDYFDAPLVYEIKKGKNGSYNLRIENLPEATIRITRNGKLTFNHGKVNIDNTMYTLNISADKNN